MRASRGRFRSLALFAIDSLSHLLCWRRNSLASQTFARHFLTFVIVTNAILAVVMGASYLQYLGGDRSESIRRVHCFEVSAEFFLRPALNETTNTETLELVNIGFAFCFCFFLLFVFKKNEQ